MKSLIIFSLIFINSLSAQTHYYNFSELKGIEDNSANTHLFYRLYTFEIGPVIGDYFENSIYHFDLFSQSDSLFLFEGGRFGDFITRIVDVEFWDNNPDTYIYLGEGISVDPVAFIQRYDQQQAVYTELGEGYSLELGKQNDSIIFATAPVLIKSIDGGYNWTPFTIPLKVVSISPFSDDEIFFTNWDGDLVKTDDGLQSITTVDTNHYNPQIFYDKDSMHIYSLTNNGLKVSNDRGNAFSWINRYLSLKKIFLTVDYSQSGKIYLADGKRILVSDNYGMSFNEFKILNKNIVGIYKKPGSDILYAATKYNLYEITPDTAIIIKSLPIDPDVFEWFPLEAGNKWIYKETVCYDDLIIDCRDKLVTYEVTKGSILNNNKYFYIKDNAWELNWDYVRLDSTDGKVYKYDLYNLFPEDEYPVIDLLADPGDTIPDYLFNSLSKVVYNGEMEFQLFGETTQRKIYSDSSSYSLPLTYTIAKGFGLDSSFHYPVGYIIIKTLKGALLNGIVYGDTTTVDVDDEPKKIIKEFSLSQNYPNPFNPTTKIKYSIPNGETGHAPSLQVTLKVYDVLGREVATLVNEEKQPGVYVVEFNPISGIRNLPAGRQGLASGVYYYQLKAGNYIETRKMILIK